MILFVYTWGSAARFTVRREKDCKQGFDSSPEKQGMEWYCCIFLWEVPTQECPNNCAWAESSECYSRCLHKALQHHSCVRRLFLTDYHRKQNQPLFRFILCSFSWRWGDVKHYLVQKLCEFILIVLASWNFKIIDSLTFLAEKTTLSVNVGNISLLNVDKLFIGLFLKCSTQTFY